MGSLVKVRPKVKKPALETLAQASNGSETPIVPFAVLSATNAAVQLVVPGTSLAALPVQ